MKQYLPISFLKLGYLLCLIFGSIEMALSVTGLRHNSFVLGDSTVKGTVGKKAGVTTTRVFSHSSDGYNSFRIPCLAKAKNGNLIAFAEGRKQSILDYGDIDLVYKISTNNGGTWSKLKVVVAEGDGTWGNPTAVTDQETGRIWLFLSWNDGTHSQHGGSFNGKTYTAIKEWGQRKIFATYSDDNGQSWVKPVDYTNSLLPSNYSWDAVGPGIGIQVANGAHKGRLIIPAGRRNIYSDDHGASWKYAPIPAGTFEGTIVELSDNSLMRNDRGVGAKWSNSHTRFIATGTIENGFSVFTKDDHLPDPRCQASILRYSFSPNILLFLNPVQNDKDGAANRCIMTIRLSEDDGATWKYAKLLYPGLDKDSLCRGGLGGYSSLMQTADDAVAAMTEVNHNVVKVPVAQRRFSIDFHKFTIDWIKE
ncbi:sialidase family protein [Niabella hibiscisoli]|uniref:sialidase family protein n=1 Tax=Niabella hibiscisoli TaxID=1825928 RepID=UPI001F0F94CE|nr:sialidase family protein [Niabella hibiscisoli]MCH5720053.1 glycoside hydrolase [Niabella hibiscisoli]